MLIRDEQSHAINGVNGRLGTLRVPPAPWVPGVFANQAWTSESRVVGKRGEYMQVDMRFDDRCRNGHMTFAITASIYKPRRADCLACGCLHDEIRKHFPELATFIAWHLCATDGPMHYFDNAIFLAGDRDCYGLRKGETRQIRNGKTGAPSWILQAIVDGKAVSLSDLPRYVDGAAQPAAVDVRYMPLLRIGEGKERQLDDARHRAIWPDATDAQLTADPDDLRAALAARLPGLVAQFKAAMIGAGFLWAAPVREEG